MTTVIENELLPIPEIGDMFPNMSEFHEKTIKIVKKVFKMTEFNDKSDLLINSIYETIQDSYLTYSLIYDKYEEVKEIHFKNSLTRARMEGREIVQLDESIYGKLLQDASLCVKIHNTEKYILISDSITTMEGEVYHNRNIPNNIRMCNDTEQYSSVWKIILGRNGDEIYHNFSAIDYILYDRRYWEKSYALAKGIKQCSSCGRWSGGSSRCSCSSGELDSYHRGGGEEYYVLGADTAKMRVGLELEKSTTQDYEKSIKMKQKGWRCERDGSCTAEYISPIIPIDDIETAIDFVKTTGHGVLSLSTDASCGGHIHISMNGETPTDVYKRIEGYRPLLWALYPQRAGNRYCHKDSDKNSKYADVGIRGATVEIRIFPGLDSERKLRFRLSLVKYMLDNPKKEREGALENLLTDEKLHKILKISYGKNTKRMEDFFARLKEYYNIDEKHEKAGRVQELSQEFIAMKEGAEHLSSTVEI